MDRLSAKQRTDDEECDPKPPAITVCRSAANNEGSDLFRDSSSQENPNAASRSPPSLLGAQGAGEIEACTAGTHRQGEPDAPTGSNVVQTSGVSKMEGGRLTQRQGRLAKAAQSISQRASILKYKRLFRKSLNPPPSDQDKSETKLKGRNSNVETSLSGAVSGETPGAPAYAVVEINEHEPDGSSLPPSSNSVPVGLMELTNESVRTHRVQTQPGAVRVEGPDHIPNSEDVEQLSRASPTELAVAAEVAPNEEEIEAQVQARVTEERGEIVAQAQRNLLDQAVRADVVTEEDLQDNKAVRLRRLLLLLGLFATTVAIVVPVTILTVKQDGGRSRCTLCADGSIPDDIDARFFTFNGDGVTCTKFMEKQNDIDAFSDACTQGQALAWRHCGCPTLPPFPENTTCSLNFDGSLPIKDPARVAFDDRTCNDWNTFVAHFESSSQCGALEDELKSLALFCASDSVLLDFLNNLLLFMSWREFLKKGSPQADALYWLAVTDTAHLNTTASITELRERYAAAVFYFATGGPSWGCSFGFLSNSSVCTWNDSKGPDEDCDFIFGGSTGLFCSDEGVIEKIAFEANNLVGALPDELTLLTGLRTIYIPYNMITGTIPQSVWNLNALEQFQIEYNVLTGEIPFSLITIPTLKVLWLGWNIFTGGPLPSVIGSSSTLESFRCSGCSLTGTIPTSIIDDLPHLKELRLGSNMLTGPLTLRTLMLDTLWLDYNQLTGTVPSVNALTELTDLDLYSNNFTGPIPDFAGKSGNTVLERLVLSLNQLTGPLPTSLCALTQLKFLRAGSNFLTGTIPSAISNLTTVEHIDISDNQLTGSLPSSLGELSQLEKLEIYNNSFTGTMPSFLEKLVNIGNIDFSNNAFTFGRIPSWLGNLDNLYRLSMRNTGVTGAIATELGRLEKLQELDLGVNELSGTVPTHLGNCLELHTLKVDRCGLGGSFPSTIANLYYLQNLYINGNNFTNDYVETFCNRERIPPYGEFAPVDDDFATLKANCLVETVVCPCCTDCCDGQGMNCVCVMNCDDDYNNNGDY